MRMLFMGRKQNAARALQWSVEKGFDVVGVVTDSHLPSSITAKTAKELGIPVLTLEDVYRAIESGELDIDIAVSFVYWRIIKEPLLSCPKFGIINFHPAPLPLYKGTAGYNLAILDELDEWSVTAHYVDESIDTGPIIDDFKFSIDAEEETALTLEKKSQDFMLSLYKKTMKRTLREGVLESQIKSGGKYISRSKMEAMKKIQEGDDIDKKIRAFWFPPYVGAYIEIEGAKYTLINEFILRSLVEEGRTYQI